MKKSVFGIALTAMMMTAVFTGCDGPAGPQGTQGEQGAQGGQGTQGPPGVSIVWQGALESAPANPQESWAYFNTTSGNAYIWAGGAWQILSQRGAGINWLGEVEAGEKPDDAGLNYALHYLCSGNTYIFDGEEWRVMLPGTTVQPPDETVVTGIVLSHTGTLSIPVGSSRVVYATVTPATAVFQWVEWTVDNNYVSIARRPRSGIFAGPETAISIRANYLGTATITATAMGSGSVELSATLTVEVVEPLTVDMGYGVTMTMNRIEAGTFMRGQTGVVTPVHQVTLTRDFYMGIHPVTREQFHAVMNANPSGSGGTLAPGEQERRPVETVNWYHAIAFANRLSIMQGLDPVYYIPGIDWGTLTFAEVPTSRNETWDAVTADWDASGFRLATDAEWEFAARAGTTTQWSFGDTYAGIDYYAWTNRNSGWRTHQVGQLRPNPWGLYDMHGNVWEWVWDWMGGLSSAAQTDPTGPAAGASRVIRGGSWVTTPDYARSANRLSSVPDNRGTAIGFRVVRP